MGSVCPEQSALKEVKGYGSKSQRDNDLSGFSANGSSVRAATHENSNPTELCNTVIWGVKRIMAGVGGWEAATLNVATITV